MSKANLSEFVRHLGMSAKRHSPEILTGIGIAGMFSSVVLAVKATPKALRLIKCEEDAKLNGKHDSNIAYIPLTPVETVKLTWKCYVPTAITVIMSTACLIGASSVNSKRNAALATAYTISESALKEYQSKVVETIGENKAKAIKDEVAKERVKKNPVVEDQIIMTGRGDTLCLDVYSGRYFKTDIEDIRQRVNELNQTLLREDTITLNDMYYAIGIRSTKMGDEFGWHVDNGLIELSLSSQLTENNTPCLVIDYSVDPLYNYQDSYRGK